MSTPGNERSAPADGLRRVLGPARGLGLTLGVVIGAGIFVLPAHVAPLLPGPGWFLGIWVLAGFVALCTAVAYAELATVYPHTGGYVVYLREIYGDRMAFVYGWAAVLVLYPSGIAGVAATFAEALLHVWPVDLDARLPATALVLAALVLQVSGVEPSSRTQVLLTGAKVAALASLALAGLIWTGSGVAADPTPAVPLATTLTIPGLFLAYVIAGWCFDGFLEIVVVAGEVRQPARVLWRVLVATVLLVTLLYLLYAGALLRQLGLSGIAASASVAADLSGRLLGPAGSRAVDLLVMLATGSGVVAVLYSGPRLLVALAQSHLFFGFAGRVSARTGSPTGAVVAMGLAALVYASIGTLGELVKYFQVTTSVFSAVILGGGLWLRARGRVAAEHRRVPLWPFPPLVAIAAAAGSIVYVVRDQPRASMAGLVVIALAIPVAGWLLRRFRPRDGT
jgi:amino acid transporter